MGVISMFVSLALVLALVGVVLAVGYSAVYSRNVKTGSLVSMQFAGNPAMITTAVMGAQCGMMTSVSAQWAADIETCDVPGSCGVYSSWLSNGGVNYAAANPTLCSASIAHWWDNTSCTTDDECLTLSHMPCGSSVSGYGAGAAATETQCGAASYSDGTKVATCSDPVSGFCVLTDHEATLNPQCSQSKCMVYGLAGELCTATTCSSNGDCFAGQSCSTSGDDSICVGYPTPHLSLNVPMRAEGRVVALNTDGTADVNWDRVQVLYSATGPAANWSYTNCRFVADTSAEGVQEAWEYIVRLALFGSATTVSGGSGAGAGFGVDPQGFSTLYSLSQFTLSGQAQLPAILPAAAEAGATDSYVAWGLRATGIPTASLTAILANSINHNPVTTDTAATWTRMFSITSASGAYVPYEW